MHETIKDKVSKETSARRNICALASLSACIILLSCKPQNSGTVQSLPESTEDSLSKIAALMNKGIAELIESSDPEDSELSFGGQTLPSRPGQAHSIYMGRHKNIFRKVSETWTRLSKNPCRIWAPILRNVGPEINKPYFFVGVSGEAGVGLHGMVGRDIVWDLYNLQISVFNYKSVEMVFGAGAVGAGVNIYAGLGFGNKRDINDAWSGRFATTGASGSLPVLSEYLSGHLSYFSALTPQGRPDHRFRGGSVGLSVGVGAPTALPGALQLSTGTWTADQIENQKLSTRLTRFGIKNSTHGAETCQGRCLRIDNIKPGLGYTGRAVNLARSMPLVSTAGGAGYLHGLENIMLLAIATGAFRDAQNKSYLCRS